MLLSLSDKFGLYFRELIKMVLVFGKFAQNNLKRPYLHK